MFNVYFTLQSDCLIDLLSKSTFITIVFKCAQLRHIPDYKSRESSWLKKQIASCIFNTCERLTTSDTITDISRLPPQVRDQEIPVKRNFVKVVIHVEDCNDHSPAFLSPRYEVSISNLAPTGSEVIRVKALDKDVGSNADITYSLHSGEQ